jgi:hypothetical protein
MRHLYSYRQNPSSKSKRRYIVDGKPVTHTELVRDNIDDVDFIEWLDGLRVGESKSWGGGAAGSFKIKRLEDGRDMPRHPASRSPLTLAQKLDGLAAWMAGLDEDELEDFDFYDEVRPILNMHLGRPLGPSADWVNPTWHIDGDLYLFEGDYHDYDVVSRVPADDPDEPDVIEEVEHLPDFKALRRYFHEHPRKNPSRARIAADWPDELKDLVASYTNDFVSDATGPWAVYDVVVDKYVEKIMRELGDAPYESETASDNFIDRWERGLVEGEVVVVLGNALEGRRWGRAAHHTPVRLRRNSPRRPRQVDLFAPPPPPPPKKNPRPVRYRR